MPTVQEILKQSGLSDEAIQAIDSKAITAMSGVLSTAEQARQQAAQAREAAELAQRSNSKFYEETIAPSLNSWAAEKANYDAQLGYYKSQLESARSMGVDFAPPPDQARDAGGRYVANAPGSTPGSPTFAPADVQRALSNGVSNIGWAMQMHQKLTGEILPDSFDQLASEADAQRMPFRDYVSRKYDYAGREKAMQAKAQQEHDDRIRAEERAAVDRKWAERTGSNPDVRRLEPSRFADVARAVKANERPDPLSLDATARKRATTQAIRSEVLDKGGEAA